ncbi:MAG: PAS domain S-box protein [Kiritimatiellae bacterium]|nr:PAS domain S-box protein [Kiritimatiellia bacterium]
MIVWITGTAALSVGVLVVVLIQFHRFRRTVRRERETQDLLLHSLKTQLAFQTEVNGRLPVGLWVKRVENHKTYYVLWNQTMAELSGLSADNVLGKEDREIYPAEQAAMYVKSDFELMQTRQTRKTRMDETLDANGQHRYIQVTKIPLVDSSGEITAIIGLVEDLTGRVKAIESLRASETRLRQVLDAAPIGICQTTRKGDRLLYANPTAAWLFGFQNVEDLQTATAEIGVKDLFYAYPDDHARLVSEFLQSGKPWASFNTTLRRKDAQPFDAHLNLCLRESGIPGNEHYYSFIEDVTDQRKTEEENTLLHRELEHVARVNTMGQLAASIAHEINQPLAAILANAQAARRLIQQGETDLGEMDPILQDIIQDDRRAGDVIHKLRVLLQRKIVDIVPVDINPLVVNVTGFIQGELESNRIELRLGLDESIPSVGGDPIQLQQVLLNLMTNALESMRETPPPQRILSITSCASMGMVELRVTDTGQGLPCGKTDQVFDPFFTTKENGLGMGLAINKTILRALGGQLDVQPNPERGVTFFVRIPVFRPAL